MANYTDKAAKALYPHDFERLKKWRKTSLARWSHTRSPACSS